MIRVGGPYQKKKTSTVFVPPQKTTEFQVGAARQGEKSRIMAKLDDPRSPSSAQPGPPAPKTNPRRCNIIRYNSLFVAGGPEPRKIRPGHHQSPREFSFPIIRVGGPYAEKTSTGFCSACAFGNS
jgi:hypothetical protein